MRRTTACVVSLVLLVLPRPGAADDEPGKGAPPRDVPAWEREAGDLANRAREAEGKQDLASALSLRKAIVSLVRTNQPESVELPSVLDAMGQLQYRLGRPAEALSTFEESLTLFRRLLPADHRDVARGIGHVALALQALGRAPEALPLLEESLAMRKRLHRGDDEEVANGLGNLGAALWSLGRAAEALPLQQESLAMSRRLHPGDHAEVARGLLNVGASLSMLGREAEAIAVQEESLAMWRRLTPGDHTDMAANLNNLSRALTASGRASEALPLQQEALAMWRRLFPGDHPQVASGLGNLAATLKDLGKPADALPLFEESVAMKRRLNLGDHPSLAVGLLNLAQTLKALERAADALPVVEESLAMLRRLFPGDHPHVFRALQGVATTLDALGRRAEALPLKEEALAMSRRLFPGDHPDVVLGLNNLAFALDTVGRTAEALPLFEEGYAMAGRLGSPQRHALGANLGCHLLHERRPRDAVEPLRVAIEALEAMRTDARGLRSEERASFVDSLRGSNDPYALLLWAYEELGDSRSALGVLERGRGREMLDLLLRARVDPLAEARARARGKGDPAALAAMDRVDVERQAAEAEVIRRAAEVERARARRDVPRADLSRLSANEALARRDLLAVMSRVQRLAGDTSPTASPLAPSEVQALLAKDERLLAYSLVAEVAIAFVVSRDSIDMVLLGAPGAPVGRAAFAQAVEEFAGALASPASTDVVAKGQRLFAMAVPPRVWSSLQGAVRVYVMPHGPLHAVPFEALVVGEREGKPVFWAEGGPPIAYEPSATVLSWLRSRRAPTGERPDLVAIADPMFAGNAAPGSGDRGRALAPLPGTRREAAAIANAFRARLGEKARVAVLLGREATEANLMAATKNPRFLHLATHGFADETETASFSALALTMPSAPVPGDDGFLTLIDLFERWRGRLEGTDLVVLSACESTKGRMQRDEGMYGLPWGFLFAGARSVVGSLWKVDDESTAFLMEDFYRRLLEDDGKDPLKALAEARLATKAKYPHPHDWAAFVFTGAPRRYGVR